MLLSQNAYLAYKLMLICCTNTLTQLLNSVGLLIHGHQNIITKTITKNSL